MSQYTLFFSWQNDRKDTRSVINAALREAKAALEADGIELVVDQDTRNRTGKRNIDAEVLDKIRHCDIFLADLTPVVTYTPAPERHDLPKHMPNSNVMYEYGYALHAKGENRMIVLATLNPQSLYRFDEVFVHAPHDIGSFYLQWSLSSRTFPAEGSLLVHVEPDYEYDTEVNDELAGTEQVVDLIKEE